MRICEVCGREITGPAYVAMIEGAELIVCGECVRYARWFRRLKRGERAVERLQARAGVRRPLMARAVRPGVPTRISELEKLEVVEDYGERVRRAREARGLTQEELGQLIGEKASVISRIESGKMVPDIALARKLEHALGIELLTRASEEVKVRAAKPPPVPALTLGDILAMSAPERGKRGHEEAEGHSG